ncbi:MAG: hypothetical protein IKJ30_03860 [Bacilli bacterium]|nr:hypothetical protein [Bacilli bacterium]
MDPSILPPERKISLRRFLYLFNYVPIIVYLFLIVVVFLIIAFVNIKQVEGAYIASILGVVFLIASSFIIFKYNHKAFDYIISVKKGTRCFVLVRHISYQKKPTVRVSYKTSKKVIFAWVEMSKNEAEKISQYSKLPAFYYMGSIFLDWKNIDEYGIR